MDSWLSPAGNPPLSWVLFGLITAAAAITAGHALLYKRDSRAALGWIAVCLTFPVAGPLLYFLFGFNRIRTRARRLIEAPVGRPAPSPAGVDAAASTRRLPREFRELVRTGDALTRHALVGGNAVEPLENGEQAYPRMLDAIEQAQERLFLATYLFETNRTGRRFTAALAAAVQRGVDVRVLLDGVGQLYSFPSAYRLLRRHGVPVARFLPPRLLPPSLHVNLRNHRKILVADGRVAFTGGMNLGDRHLASSPPRGRVTDLHFRLRGPVVSQIEQVFCEDWEFVTGRPAGPCAAAPAAAGGAVCRVIVEGPNEDLDKLAPLLVGAVGSARHSVQIMTPYFLPPRELISALQTAALRGVDVAVILPQRNNIPLVHWATRNMLWELLQRGVRVYYRPPPFAHTKMFVVDGRYAQLGSANLDPRSLRLNFELMVEVYDEAFAATLGRHFDGVRGESSPIELAQLDARPLPVRLRDALAWLFSPYL